MQTSNVAPPEPGTLVFSSDGEEIGEIAEVLPEYFSVKKGLIFRKELYIPISSIVGTALGGDGVMLDITKDQIENGDWSQPPDTAEGRTDPDAAQHNTMGVTTPHSSTDPVAGREAALDADPPLPADPSLEGGLSRDQDRAFGDDDAFRAGTQNREDTTPR